MRVPINENYQKVGESYLFAEIEKRVAAYGASHPDKKVIRLGVGDVTLPLSGTVVEAMARAAREMGEGATFRGYPPYFGYDFLIEAIKNHYARRKVALSADEIFVSDGAKSDAANFTEPFGNAPVYVVDPAYPVYVDANIMAGKDVRFIAAAKENGFCPLPGGRLADGSVVYLCSPNNPSGVVYDKKTLRLWVDAALKTGSLIIFDSAYESYISGDDPHSIFEISGARGCAVEICSLSKTAGFTGVRCSWTVIPKEITLSGVPLGRLWARRQSTKFNGVGYVTQRGAEAALSNAGYAECLQNIAYYMENARRIAELLYRKGIFYTGGKSSPFVFMECPRGASSWEFFDFLLESAQTVGTPGAGFGKGGEGFFRLTGYAAREDAEEALSRMSEVL